MTSKAKFSLKTKEQISERDNGLCILCLKPWTVVHHCYFWLKANRWTNRNDVDQWCILDYDCHHLVHNGNWKELAQECINYLNNL
jgi:hypothetical protein